MKKFTMLALLLFVAQASFAIVKEGIDFLPEETSFQEVLNKAKAENKIIFIDAYTTWCGPCKWLDQNVFTDSEVGNYFNEHFISAKFDMEKGEGIELAEKYGVMAYPTLLFVDGDGNLVHRICGAAPKEKFLELSKVALDTENRIGTYLSRYDEGERSVPFVRELLIKGFDACMDMGDMAAEYWNMQEQSEWATAENYRLFVRYVDSYDSEQFQYFLQHVDAFKANAENPEQINHYAEQVFYTTLARSIHQNNLDKFNTDKAGIEKLNWPVGNKSILKATILKHQKAKDWVAYSNEAEKYYSSFGATDANYINSLSWSIFQNIDDQETLLKASEWMKEVVATHENYAFMDTYAALLLKGGNKTDGTKAANKAIEIAKTTGDDYSGTEEILKTYN